MKEQKGMGHITLFISMIIILMILGAIIYFAIFNIQETKIQNYETNMLLIKGKTKILSEESAIKNNEELLKGRKVSENLEDEQIKKMLEKEVISEEEENFSKYYILDDSNLEEMGLDSIKPNKGYYIVNYESGEIIYTEGVKINKELYYKLSDIKQKEDEKDNDNEISNKEENQVQETEAKDENGQEKTEETGE